MTLNFITPFVFLIWHNVLAAKSKDSLRWSIVGNFMRAEERANQCVSLLSSIKMHEASTFSFLKGSLIKGYTSFCRKDFQRDAFKVFGINKNNFFCLKIKNLDFYKELILTFLKISGQNGKSTRLQCVSIIVSFWVTRNFRLSSFTWVILIFCWTLSDCFTRWSTCERYIYLRSMANYNIGCKLSAIPKMIWANS